MPRLAVADDLHNLKSGNDGHGKHEQDSIASRAKRSVSSTHVARQPRVALPQDDDAVQLFDAVNAFRESRGMFPVGKLHMDKLYKLLTVTEGAFKVAMCEIERLVGEYTEPTLGTRV